MRHRRSLGVLAFSIGLGCCLSFWHCGTSSPTDETTPVSLPTPFSGAIATQPVNGKSTIVGSSGSVAAGTTITLSLESSADISSPIQATLSSRCSGTTTADANGFWTLEVDAAVGDNCKISTSTNLEGLVVVKTNIIGLGFQASDIALSTSRGYFSVVGKDTLAGSLDTTENATTSDDRGIFLTLLESCNSEVGRVANCCDYTANTDIATCVGDRFSLPQNPDQTSYTDADGNGSCKSSGIDYLDDPQTVAMAVGSNIALVVDRDNSCVEDVTNQTSTNRGGALMVQISKTGTVSVVKESNGASNFVPLGAVTGGKYDAEDSVSIFGQDLSLWDPKYVDNQKCSYMAPISESDPDNFASVCGALSSNISGKIVTSRAVEYIPVLNRAVQIVQYTTGTYLYVWNADNVVNKNGSAHALVGAPIQLNKCASSPIDLAAYHVNTTAQTANLIWTDGATKSQSLCTAQVDLANGLLVGTIQEQTTPGTQPWGLVLVPKAAIAGGENPSNLSSLQSNSFVRAYYTLRGSDKLACLDLNKTIGKESLCSNTCATGSKPAQLEFDVGSGHVWVISEGHHTVQILDVDTCE